MDRDFWAIFFMMLGPVLLVLAAIMFAVALYQYGLSNGYNDGWCHAEGGIYVGYEQCSINGQVISID